MDVGHKAQYSITGLNPFPWIAWWYKFAAPQAPINAEQLPLREREFLRRGKLISIALLIEIIEMLIAIGAGIQDPNKALLPILLSIITVLLISSLLNRGRKQLFAGILVIIVVEVGMIGNILGAPHGLLSTFQLPLLCLLAQPLMISVLLFATWGVFVVAGCNIIFICSFLLFLPKTPELIFYLKTQPYVVYSIPVTLQVVCALISFIVVQSLQENLRRADQAEEISKLQTLMAQKNRREIEEKQQLEGSTRMTIAALTNFANGDRTARVPVEGNALGPIAWSINNIIGRFTRLQEQETMSERTTRAISLYIQEIRLAKLHGNNTIPHIQTGTPVDQLVEEIVAIGQKGQAHSSTPLKR